MGFRPNIPQNEKEYQIIGYHTFNTVTGLTLILELNDPEEDKQFTFSFPDIQRVEMNNLSTERHEKYYLHCMVRPHHFRAEELKEWRANGMEIDGKEFTEEYKASTTTYRVIFRLKQTA